MNNQPRKSQLRRTVPQTQRRTTRRVPTRAVVQSRQAIRTKRKVPEALPKKYRESPFTKLKSTVFRKKPAIQEIVREPTSGGIVFRISKDRKDIEILLIQDSKNRWTIPKGHIEPGENAKQTAIREIGEESGLHHISALCWLGKINFKYRRMDKLVLMTTQIYLVRSLDDHEIPQKEKWMNGIKWFKFADALDAIEYEDIEKLMLIAKKKIRSGEF
ncbi:NUDIX domain-containing protein [Candidatus Saccharibacteria bacterium]|nr:NUDIX domain-containing protein [Candidatus Saccharibacteria bacterium]